MEKVVSFNTWGKNITLLILRADAVRRYNVLLIVFLLIVLVASLKD